MTKMYQESFLSEEDSKLSKKELYEKYCSKCKAKICTCVLWVKCLV